MTIDAVTGIATTSVRVTGKHGARVKVQAFYKGAGPFLASAGPVITVTIK